MKADWEALGDEYASSSSVLIGDVDCTVETALCSEMGVSGYPTIKYWKDGKANDYQSGRDAVSLKKHVKDNLEVACTISDPSGCTAKEVAFIGTAKALDSAAVTAQLNRLNGMKGNKMSSELKTWLFQRINILTQVAKSQE